MRTLSLRLRLLVAVTLASAGSAASSQEVVVLGGVDEAIEWLQAADWWGEEDRSVQLTVPRIVFTGINPSWRETVQRLAVGEKKEIFYRFILPLILHANDLVLEHRRTLLAVREALSRGQPASNEALAAVREWAPILRVASREAAAALPSSGESLLQVVDELLDRVDVIPPALALGQAAYESGYGTSRFAIEGNALFGQWTFGGDGLVPEQQRSNLGDHRIAAYDWPFDSVRGYFLNLMSHPAYEEFRRLRRELRANGEPLDSLVLADGLTSYSERGQEYVDTLKGIIRVNRLEIADDAVLRDEPMRFIVGAQGRAARIEMEEEIRRLRASGEFATIVARMRLE
jgi:Bax protein